MSAPIMTYRLYKAGKEERFATAKTLHNGTLFQVYPSKKQFDTLEEWRANWPQCEEIRESKRMVTPRPKKPSYEMRRRNYEIMEFFEPEYLEMVKNLKVEARAQADEPVVHITEKNGTEWKISRSLDFLKAPSIWKNGERYGESLEEENYSPALTAVRWWMMLAFLSPDVV
jgi:hypothetical protein